MNHRTFSSSAKPKIRFKLGHWLTEGTVRVLLVLWPSLFTFKLRVFPQTSSARVAYTKVELQLKLRGIPCTYLEAVPSSISDLSFLQSSLSRSVPGLCVQSSDILAGAPAAEAAMPNIRVIL